MWIYCTIIGVAGSAFGVDIDASTTVAMLKDAIKAENSDIKCSSRLMRLFLARKDGMTWLMEKDLIKNMRKGEISTETMSSYMVEELEAMTEKIYEKLPNTIPDGIIHVLVVFPAQEESSGKGLPEKDSSSIYALATSRLLEFTFLNVCSTAPSRAQTMKAKLVEAYKCDCREENENGESMLLCMVMDIALPSSVVIGSHIFRRECAPLQEWIVGIDNIEDVRNGLLLFKPIKSAMDNLDIAFLGDKYDQFSLKVFNPSIKARLLVDWLTDEQWDALGLDSLPTGWRNNERPLSAPNAPSFDVLTTFGELDGKTLQFPSGYPLRPFRRCLYFQAQLARARAITEEWVEKEYSFDDFLSEGLDLKEKMKLYFSKM